MGEYQREKALTNFQSLAIRGKASRKRKSERHNCPSWLVKRSQGQTGNPQSTAHYVISELSRELKNQIARKLKHKPSSLLYFAITSQIRQVVP